MVMNRKKIKTPKRWHTRPCKTTQVFSSSLIKWVKQGPRESRTNKDICLTHRIKTIIEGLWKNGKIFFDIYARVMKTLRGFPVFWEKKMNEIYVYSWLVMAQNRKVRNSSFGGIVKKKSELESYMLYMWTCYIKYHTYKYLFLVLFSFGIFHKDVITQKDKGRLTTDRRGTKNKIQSIFSLLFCPFVALFHPF